MSLTEQAENLLHEWVQSESLRTHCAAVAATMRHFAREQGADADLWGAVGLLHDMDYERYPNLELKEDAHPFVGVAYLREHGWSEEACHAILAHADYSGVVPETPMEKTLIAIDELSGFVTAVARVRPSKSIYDVDVASVKKKFKDKAFARAVSRDDMNRGAAYLNMPIDDLIQHVITALQDEAPALGIEGTTPRP